MESIVRRGKREEGREKREERRSRDQEKRRDIEMKRNERRDIFFKKNVSRPSNPPDELPQNVSKKNPFRTNYSSIFLQKFRIWSFFIYLHDSNSIFRAGELIQNYFRAVRAAQCQCSKRGFRRFPHRVGFHFLCWRPPSKWWLAAQTILDTFGLLEVLCVQ